MRLFKKVIFKHCVKNHLIIFEFDPFFSVVFVTLNGTNPVLIGLAQSSQFAYVTVTIRKKVRKSKEPNTYFQTCHQYLKVCHIFGQSLSFVPQIFVLVPFSILRQLFSSTITSISSSFRVSWNPFSFSSWIVLPCVFALRLSFYPFQTFDLRKKIMKKIPHFWTKLKTYSDMMIFCICCLVAWSEWACTLRTLKVFRLT